MKNLAVVGIGKWGKNLIREFSRISNVSICHSNDNKENITWLRKNFPNTKYTKNFQDILNDKSIDAIVIATPIKTHFILSYKAIQAKKHLFIEKTIAEKSLDARKLIVMAKKQKVVLFPGHIFLHHPILNKIKQITKNEPIIYLKLNWFKTGSFYEDIFLDLVSHFVSITIELMGTIRDVKIINVRKIVSSYDIVTLEFLFEKGRRCIVDVNRISNFKKRSITIITTKNTFQWEDDTLYKFNKRKNSYDLWYKTDKTPLEIECKKFIQVLGNNVDYTDANKAFQIIQVVEKCKREI